MANQSSEMFPKFVDSINTNISEAQQTTQKISTDTIINKTNIHKADDIKNAKGQRKYTQKALKSQRKKTHCLQRKDNESES